MDEGIKDFLAAVADYEKNCEQANESDVQLLWDFLHEGVTLLKKAAAPRTVQIELADGVVHDVIGLPHGWTYELTGEDQT